MSSESITEYYPGLFRSVSHNFAMLVCNTVLVNVTLSSYLGLAIDNKVSICAISGNENFVSTRIRPQDFYSPV